MNSTTTSLSTEKLTVASVFLFLGVPANLLSIGLIVRAKEKKSTTTYLLLNLAIADVVNLIGTFVKTLTVQFAGDSQYVKIFKLTMAPKQVANFTLAFIALERFNALVKTMNPFLALLSKTKVKRAMAAFWLIALTINVPVPILLLVNKSCRDFAHSYSAYCLVVIYILPLLVILFCYSKIFKGIFLDRTILGKPVTNEAELNEKTRFVRVLVIVTVVFLLTNLPVCVVKILFMAHIVGHTKGSLKFALSVLGCVSSTVNPYVYGLQSERYREQITELFCRKKLSARHPAKEQCWDEHL